MEKLWNNLRKGLKNYLEANGFTSVILGLSGGLDSAITSVLAADVVGGENVTALMMKTRFTSDLSLQIAQKIADYNRLNYSVLDIEPLVETHTHFLEQAFGQKPANLVLENLQARLRGQILMAYSNNFGSLVLACGNKSEVLTGYCTLYGDTCGGLCPLGNIYKSTLFELAKWRNSQGIVLPTEVIERAPSAELAPGQKDETALLPYPILDAILKLYCDEGKTEEQIVAAGFDSQTVKKVADLVSRSAFKRLQLPPKLKVA